MEEHLTSKAMINNCEQLERIFRFFVWLNSRLLLRILKVNRLKDVGVIGRGLWDSRVNVVRNVLHRYEVAWLYCQWLQEYNQESYVYRTVHHLDS